MATTREFHQKSVDAIRFLAIDAVQKAKSGHPGAPMGAAPMAYVLWRDFLKHNPRNPKWFNRDRFVLSVGHASMLIYALLHLTGYEVTLDDIKDFRQLGSITPGHPEFGLTPGVEVTTGPLGQGLSNAVGFALAENMLANSFNRPNYDIVDHYTYVLASDGDIEEGVANEAVSLAGTLNLRKLICLYDDNDMSIDGSTDLHLREDVPARFRACGWATLGPVDGNDLAGIASAIKTAQTADKPTLISVKTILGFGSPNKGNKAISHGAPLGEDEVAATRKNLGWDLPPFEVPQSVYDDMREPTLERGENAEKRWLKLVDEFKAEHPAVWQALTDAREHKVPSTLGAQLQKLADETQDTLATRVTSSKLMNLIADELPYLIGGSADLAEANHSLIKKRTFYQPENRSGRNIQFGIREHAMGAISNGMALHGGFIPYAATFLVFADYMRPSVRLSALSHLHVIWIYTHDSIGVGEDGATHQPVSHLMGLRLIPNLRVFRPADMHEAATAWLTALHSPKTPSVIVLSRQATPPLASLGVGADAVKNNDKGAYIVAGKTDTTPDIILLATGTEVAIALQAHQKLVADGVNSRVVSMPCWEIFEEQDERYRQSVLPSAVTARLSVEAGATLGWQKYVGLAGDSVGMDTFGASAPGAVLMKKFGFTAENVFARAQKLLKAR